MVLTSGQYTTYKWDCKTKISKSIKFPAMTQPSQRQQVAIQVAVFFGIFCSAISRIHSFLTKLFHHEEHEGHEVLNETNGTIFLRGLRVLCGENWVAAVRVVFLCGQFIFGCGSVTLHLSRNDAVEEHDRKVLRLDLQDEVRHKEISPNGEGLFLMPHPLFHPVNPVNPVEIPFFNCVVPT
jgi:hypothetical protein